MHRPGSPWLTRASLAVRHVRVAMAVRTAAAAALSWSIALQLPDPAPEYAFYAPLGAVVAMYPTITSSARQSAQAVAAIGLGVGLALGADAVLGHGAVVVAVVVGLGVLLAGLPWLGSQRSYVPIAALFVLVIGQGREVSYSATYLGLFLLGALGTVVVNALFPSFPLRHADHRLERLQDAVVSHLRYLAERMADDDPAEPLTDRGPGRPALTERTAEARRAARQARESARGNVRARRSPSAAPTRYERFRAMERIVLLIEDLYSLARERPWGQDVIETSSDLRGPTAQALAELAELAAQVGPEKLPPDRTASVDQAVDRLTSALRRHEREEAEQAETLVVATIVTTLRRTLSVLAHDP